MRDDGRARAARWVLRHPLRELHARARAPFPVIVGAPRSGTTLLRLMLDAHSQLAIPPETGFLPEAARIARRDTAGRAAFRDLVLGSPAWPDFHLDAGAFDAALAALPRFRVAAGVRCFYALYAARFGKPRYGDKTPGYSAHLRALERLLPEAHFVHLLRDGRDVAASVRPLWFAPGASMETLARDWRERVLRARSQGRRCRRYLELRYEDLVTDPERRLRSLCAWLGLAFEPEQLRYFERAAARLAEHEARAAADGRPGVTKSERLSNQRRTNEPPDPSRIGAWRGVLTGDEADAFRRVAGDLLEELGY